MLPALYSINHVLNCSTSESDNTRLNQINSATFQSAFSLNCPALSVGRNEIFAFPPTISFPQLVSFVLVRQYLAGRSMWNIHCPPYLGATECR